MLDRERGRMFVRVRPQLSLLPVSTDCFLARLVPQFGIAVTYFPTCGWPHNRQFREEPMQVRPCRRPAKRLRPRLIAVLKGEQIVFQHGERRDIVQREDLALHDREVDLECAEPLSMLFHVVNERHRQHRAMIVTTKKHSTYWGRVLHDEHLRQAIIDRSSSAGASYASMDSRSERCT
jgi:hypothetical protein